MVKNEERAQFCVFVMYEICDPINIFKTYFTRFEIVVVSGCGRSYIEKYGLAEHTKLKHQGVTLVCDQCGKTFLSRSGLHDHIHSVHSKDLPHKCDQCGNLFRTRELYLVHVNSHYGNKLYQCDKCKKKISYKQSLQTHQLICKLNSKLKCDMCPETFTRRNVLKGHMLSKHGNTQFPCRTCGKVYKLISGVSHAQAMNYFVPSELLNIIFNFFALSYICHIGTNYRTQWRIQFLKLRGPTFLGIRIAPPLRGFPEATIKVYT